MKDARARRWADDPVIRPLDALAGARDHASPRARLEDVRSRGRALRDALLDAPPVRYLESVELVRFPYPARFAYLNALTAPTPFVHLVNRLFVVQLDSDDGVKTLLVSPSDVDANAETPYFKRMLARYGPLEPLIERTLARRGPTVEQHLARLGVAPEQVDYITYDHLHTQDLRRWLGSGGRPGVFPNARLLVMRREWESVHGLIPWQRDWYCPGGVEGVDPERVVLLDGDVRLGASVALVGTPGHTEGNHSIVCRTPDGLTVTSENGVGPDSYAPERSGIPGLARFARETGMECVLNGNTLEGSLDQYISMVLEKTLAGPSAADPHRPNVLCSSEVAAYALFPGVKPTFGFGDVRFGAPVSAVAS